MRMIPHRYPFLLVDRVVELEAFQRAVGIKNVTINEPFFPGHFPADPIMPGVLLVEAMAQTAAVLAVAGLGPAHAGNPVYFMSIDERPVPPPGPPGRPGPARGHGRCATRWACGSSAAGPWWTGALPPRPSSAPRSCAR